MNKTTNSTIDLHVSAGQNIWRTARAIADFREGLREYELWITMGIQDIKRRYRRSVLGPLWLTLSLAVLVAALGILYSALMGTPKEIFIPHLALGFIAWNFIQGAVTDGCNVFVNNKNWITNIRTPLSLFVFRMTWEHLVTMAHNALVYVGVAIIFGINAGLTGLMVLPGLLLVMFNAIWVGILFGTLCARFRDIPQIIQSIMRIAFFLTPIIWMPAQLGTRDYIAMFNPFTYFVELIRSPLLGVAPSLMTWGLALCVTIVGWAIAAVVFIRFRGRIAYWL
jgi:ABC-type polysaccharide/polyol phosphate export permease